MKKRNSKSLNISEKIAYTNLALLGTLSIYACSNINNKPNTQQLIQDTQEISENITTLTNDTGKSYELFNTEHLENCQTELCQDNQNLIDMAIEQADSISYISHLSGLPINWVTSQMYVETEGNPGSPCLRSSADAYGRVQLTKTAFKETMLSLVGMVDGSLYEKRLERQRYPQVQQAFQGINQEELTNILEDFSSEEFSLIDYIADTQERVSEYTTLNDEKPAGWIKNKRLLKKEQTKNNKELRTYLNNFWDGYIAFNGIPIRRGNTTLWHQIPLPQCSDNYAEMMDTLGALNLRREYKESLDNFDAKSNEVKRATFRYNRDRQYYRDILKNYNILENVLNQD